MQGSIQPGWPLLRAPATRLSYGPTQPRGNICGVSSTSDEDIFEGTVRIGVTCCNKLNRGCEAVTDSLRREGKNEGIVRQAGHRIIKHIHEK